MNLEKLGADLEKLGERTWRNLNPRRARALRNMSKRASRLEHPIHATRPLWSHEPAAPDANTPKLEQRAASYWDAYRAQLKIHPPDSASPLLEVCAR